MTGAHILDVLLIVTLLIAVITDIRSRKIYNWLTLPAIVCGLIVNGIFGHIPGLLFGLKGFGVATIWLALFLLGGTGAGDLKLLWAVGAMMGPHFALWTLLCTALWGFVFGVWQAIRKNELRHTINNALVGGHVAASLKSTDALEGVAKTSKVGKIAYAPAIALGAATAAYLIYAKIV